MIHLNRHLVPGLDDLPGGVPGQQVCSQALMVGIQVLNEHKGHTAIHRHAGKKPFERIQAPGRGTDSDYREQGVLRRCLFCLSGHFTGFRIATYGGFELI